MLRMYTIYEDPSDFPGRFVVRGANVTGEGPTFDREPLAVVSSLEEARRAVPPTASACMSRSINDDPVIVECWF